MKKGVIVYITEGKEALQEWPELSETGKRLGAEAVCLATSEFEVAYGWWHLLTRGNQEIVCMRGTYDVLHDRVNPEGYALRLCG